MPSKASRARISRASACAPARAAEFSIVDQRGSGEISEQTRFYIDGALVADGLIRYPAISNFSAENTREWVRIARELGVAEPVAVQIRPASAKDITAELLSYLPDALAESEED